MLKLEYQHLSQEKREIVDIGRAQGLSGILEVINQQYVFGADPNSKAYDDNSKIIEAVAVWALEGLLTTGKQEEMNRAFKEVFSSPDQKHVEVFKEALSMACENSETINQAKIEAVLQDIPEACEVIKSTVKASGFWNGKFAKESLKSLGPVSEEIARKFLKDRGGSGGPSGLS